MSTYWTKVRKTVHHHGRRLQRAARGGWWSLRRPPAVRPVFVIGCSRAGTTMVYKTFSESAQLGSLQKETHDFWAALHPLAERGWESHALSAADACDRDREQVARYFFSETGRARFVDKNNQNGLCVAYLYALFPDAHFVYVMRSPGDNINSLIEGWGRTEQFATWSADLPATVAIEGGRYTRWCFFLPPAWRDYLAAPIGEVCAYQYRSMNEAILAARRLVPPGQWTEIRYEDVLGDPVGVFRRAFAAAGLEFDARLAEHCTTLLSNPYNAFSQIRADKWRTGDNRARIERVLPQLAEIAHAMGYRV